MSLGIAESSALLLSDFQLSSEISFRYRLSGEFSMTTEFFTLLCSIGLLFVLNFYQSLQLVSENGTNYVWSKRDEPPKDSILGGRIQRAKSNLIENLLIFAPLILIANIVNVSTNLTALGSIMFLVARLLHALAYIIGVTHVRSPLWATSLVGMTMIAVAIVNGA